MNNELHLANGIANRIESLSVGLEEGIAPIYDLVKPSTAKLLRHWFLESNSSVRSLNFHEGQKKAILAAIYAEEILDKPTLPALLAEICPQAVIQGEFGDLSQERHAMRKYCLKMATGTGKTWVLEALMLWQWAGYLEPEDPYATADRRFTRNFLIVAPGLIVYDRLLDAFLGKYEDLSRNFYLSDIYQCRELFVPDDWQDAWFAFVRNAVSAKEEIGNRAVGSGLIALTNWHALEEAEEEEEIENLPGGLTLPVKDIVKAVLPLTPGVSAGNSLDQLDRAVKRGQMLEYLRRLDGLLAFNDEAHHIHETTKPDEEEVHWQRAMTSLSKAMAEYGKPFIQIDFSATPYTQGGTAKNPKKNWFPHIITDFDLSEAMKRDLVKRLVLDQRQEIAALPLDYKTITDQNGNQELSDGQKIMLRAGLARLQKLEKDFHTLDSVRHPKMMVICEDTTVTPLVENFLLGEGLSTEDILSIDSGKKQELGEKDWLPLKERLFNVDRHASPRVIISVLMLREGFDVNNICVIVPLRSAGAQILLEQTIGRGLRLMWRGEEWREAKDDARKRLAQGQEPGNLLDMLFIIEHPNFTRFYEELMADGLVNIIDDNNDPKNSAGDLLHTCLIDGYDEFDFDIPFIVHEQEDSLAPLSIDIATLSPFRAFRLEQLREMIGTGDVFTGNDALEKTRFGDYRINGGIMSASHYNEWLARMTTRIGQALQVNIIRDAAGWKNATSYPHLQVMLPLLAGPLDDYVRDVLFGGPFDPLDGSDTWRCLLIDLITEHIIKEFVAALTKAEETVTTANAEVIYRKLSEVTGFPVSLSSSDDVVKCIYDRLGWPRHNGHLEQQFIEWCCKDSGIEAFCKIHETRHNFLAMRYMKEEGSVGFYHPDFIVRTSGDIWLVETKAQGQLSHPNVQRKAKAAETWCKRISDLPVNYRENSIWNYCLVGETLFNQYKKTGRLLDLLKRCKISSAVYSGKEFAF